MKKNWIFGVVLCAAWLGAAVAKDAAPEKAPAQPQVKAAAVATNLLTELFDGHTLNGWKVG